MATALAAKARSAGTAQAPTRERREAEREPECRGTQASRSVAALQSLGGNRAVGQMLGAGTPLPERTRIEMEARFGERFGNVRIHDDARAHEGTEAMGAKAFALGSDIAFSAGRFAPQGTAGKLLLAHELAHVVQQRRGGATPPARDGGGALEAAARQSAQAVVGGTGRVAVAGASAVGVACEPEDERKPKPKGKNAKVAGQASPGKEGAAPAVGGKKAGTGKAAPKKNGPKKTDAKETEGKKVDAKKAEPEKAVPRRAEGKKADGQAAKPGGTPAAPRKAPRKTARPAAKKAKGGGAKAAKAAKAAKPKYSRASDSLPALHDPGRFDDHRAILGQRGFAVGAGVSEHDHAGHAPGAYGRIEKHAAASAPRNKANIERRTATPRAELQALDQRIATQAGAAKRLRGKARTKVGLGADEQAQLAEMSGTLATDRTRRRAIQKYVKGQEKRTPRSALDRAAARQRVASDVDPSRPGTPSKGGMLGSAGDTHAVIRVVDSRSGETVARSYGIFRADDVLRDRKYRKHAEQAALPELERQLQERGLMKRGEKADLRGYRIEVVGDREVCEDTCAPFLTRFAIRNRIDRVDGFTIVSTTDKGRPISDKKTAVLAGVASMGDSTQRQQHTPIYQGPTAGHPGGGDKGPADSSAQGGGPGANNGSKSAAHARRMNPSMSPPPKVAPGVSQENTAPTEPVAHAGPAHASHAPQALRAPQAPQAPQTPPPTKAAPGPTAPAKTAAQAPLSGTHAEGDAGHDAPPHQDASATGGQEHKRRTGPRIKGKVTTSSFHKDQVQVGVEEIVGAAKPFHVTTTISIGGGLGAKAQGERGNAGGSVDVGVSGSIAISYSHDMTQVEKDDYVASIASGRPGSQPELTVVELVASGQTDAAAGAIRKTSSVMSGPMKGDVGDSEDIAVNGEISGGASVSGQRGRMDLSLEAQASAGRGLKYSRTKMADGKELYTVTISRDSSRALGASASYYGTVGYKDSRSKADFDSKSFVLDPHADDYEARKAELLKATSLADLEAIEQRRGPAYGSGKGGDKSNKGTFSLGALGLGVDVDDGEVDEDSKSTGPDGTTRNVKGGHTNGWSPTIGGHRIDPSSRTDTFSANVRPDNTATGVTQREDRSVNWLKSAENLGASFAKSPVGTAVEIASGSKEVLKERVDTTGTDLSDDSFSRIQNLAKDQHAWSKAWSGRGAARGAGQDWEETRQRVLAADGDRYQISLAMKKWEQGDTGRGAEVEKVVGDTGIAFDFPDEIADQKPVYDQIVSPDLFAEAEGLANDGKSQDAITTYKAIEDRCQRLLQRMQMYSASASDPPKFAQAQNRVSGRATQARTAAARLKLANAKAASADAPAADRGPETGPPTQAQQAARDDDTKLQAQLDRQAANEEIGTQVGICLTNRESEGRTFAAVEKEFDAFFVSVADIFALLNKARDMYPEWDKSVEKLRESYPKIDRPAERADTFGPNRAEWNRLNQKALK